MTDANSGADGPTVLVALLTACAILSIAWSKPKTNDAPPDSFPGLARDLLPLCERAEAFRQEADEGDAPPAEMKLLCDTADGLWRIYHELKKEDCFMNDDNDNDDDDRAFCEVCDSEFDPDNPRTAVCPHCGEMLCSDKCLAEHLKDYCRRVDRGNAP